MKQTLYAVMFMLTSLLFSSCATSPEKAASSASSTGAAASGTEGEVKKIINDIREAALRGDRKVFEQVLADSYTEVDPEGNVHTKAEILPNIQPFPDTMKREIKYEEIQVRDFGDTAIASFRGHFQAEAAGGQKIKNSWRVTDFFKKQDGRWQLITEHSSSIPELTVAKVDPKLFDAYVGEYELAQDVKVTVTKESDKLFSQFTGEAKSNELLPANENTFSIKGQPGQMIFVKAGNGKVTEVKLHFNNQDTKAKKIK